VSAIDLARAERAELCDLLDELGPDRPTMCQDWTTRDLAAHLVVRESRVDTALGVLGGPLAAWTERVQNDAASQPFEKLVRLIRTGPPIWSHFRLPWVDGQLNTIEFYVHIEDVRRANGETQPRDVAGELSNFMWDRLKLSGRLFFNSVKNGVILERTDAESGELETHKAKGGKPKVIVRGPATELILIAYGRRDADVDIDGDPDAVAAFEQASRDVDEESLEENLESDQVIEGN